MFVRVRWRLFAGLLALLASSTLKASLCPPHLWTLNQIADAPVLVVGRVTSLEMENGPHFTGAPQQSAPAQTMTATLKVLRFAQQAMGAGATPSGTLKIRFVGRDGPDFSSCAVDLPELQPGQVLLVPLRANLKGTSEAWQLIGADGYGMTTE
jgi:hypothetical protein